MHIHFIIHEHFEAPGASDTWAQHRGFTISYSRVYAGEPLPESIEHIDFLIVMGGPQDPATTAPQCSHFNAKAEQKVIAAAINSGKVVLGICLGAQLIGEALGARYEHSPEREIGKFPIMLTHDGLIHPLFEHFGAILAVGHWHNDMPGLTESSKVMAYSEGCPRQIIAYSDFVFGFQCHMEFTTDLVQLLIEHSAFNGLEKCRFIDKPEILLQHDYHEMNQKLYEFLDKLLSAYQSRN